MYPRSDTGFMEELRLDPILQLLMFIQIQICFSLLCFSTQFPA